MNLWVLFTYKGENKYMNQYVTDINTSETSKLREKAWREIYSSMNNMMSFINILNENKSLNNCTIEFYFQTMNILIKSDDDTPINYDECVNTVRKSLMSFFRLILPENESNILCDNVDALFFITMKKSSVLCIGL